MSDHFTVSYSENIKKSDLKEIKFQDILEKMRHDSDLKSTISKIRQEKNPALKRSIKASLPYFNFGKFKDNYRKNENFEQTRFLVFDIDGLTEKKLIETRNILAQSAQTYLLFVSPSGNGLKFVVRLEKPIFKADHYEMVYRYYKDMISRHLKIELDKTVDAARATFLSYDENLVYNEECTNLPIDISIEQPKKTTYKIDDKRIPALIGDAITYICQKWHGNEVDYYEWISVGMALKNTLPPDVGFNLWKRICDNDYYTKNGSNFVELEAENKWESFDTDGEKQVSAGTIFWIAENLGWRFPEPTANHWWNIVTQNIKGIETQKVIINRIAFLEFLEECGFIWMWYGGTKILIQKKNNIIRQIDAGDIRRYVRNWIETAPDKIFESDDERRKVLAAMLKGANQYLNNVSFDFLNVRSVEMNRDTRNEAWLLYSNMVIKVTKDDIEEMTYNQLPGAVWESQYIDRDFKRMPGEYTKSEYYEFLKKTMVDDDRLLSAMSVHGYLIHTFKKRSNVKAIILMDEEIKRDKAIGGTGKGIICQALSNIIPTVKEDGRVWSPKNNFPFQVIQPDTKLFIIDDIKRTFPFQMIFSVITENMSIERKNKEKVNLDFEDTPKIIISTNYAINDNDPAARRRIFELELSNFFNQNNTPEKYFGHMLFDDWDENEWQLFDNFMTECIAIYLKYGLIDYERHNVYKKQIVSKTSYDFLEWCEETLKNGRHDKSELYLNFVSYSGVSERGFSRNKFSYWLRAYCDYVEAELDQVRNEYIISGIKTDPADNIDIDTPAPF